MTAVRQLHPGTGPVTRAALAGTPRQVLVSMAERVAAAIDDPDTHARDLASLTHRLMVITAEIERLDAKAPERSIVVKAAAGEFDPSAV